MARRPIHVEFPKDAGHLIHTLMDNIFPHKETAFRELVQNAQGSGATDVWFYIGKSNYGEGPDDIACIDNGGGMNAVEAEEELCRIGAGKNPMGRFGLGFLSCFALSEKAIVYSVKKDPKTSHFTAVKLHLSRATDYSGPRPSTTISGEIDDEIDIDELGNCGLYDPTSESVVGGTKIVLRNPILRSGNNIEQLSLKPERVNHVLEQWCKHIDPQQIRIWFNTPNKQSAKPINVGMTLLKDPKAITRHFQETISFYVPGTPLSRQANVQGCIAFATSIAVSLLQYGIYVCSISNISDQEVSKFQQSLGCVQALINCDQFYLNVARDHVEANSVLFQVLDALRKAVDTQLVPTLIQKIQQQEPLTNDEVAYAKHRISLAIKDNEAIEENTQLQVLSAVPTFSTLTGQQISLNGILSEVEKKRRIYYAQRKNDETEQLVNRNHIVLQQYGIDITAFTTFLKKRGGEIVDVSTLTKAIDCRVIPDEELSPLQRDFLKLCRQIDSAVHLGEIRDWKGDILQTRLGYYESPSGKIVLNVKSDRIQRALETEGSFSWLLAFPTIVHGRAHEKVKDHGEQFLTALEGVLDEKCQNMVGILSASLRRGGVEET